LGVEADAAVQVIDVQVDVEAFHGDSFQQEVQARVDSLASHTPPWQQCSVQVAEQPVHVGEVGAVDQVAALLLDGDQPAWASSFR
jgi:hypothetical protein